MIRLGFLGVKSSHAKIFGQLINVDSRYAGLRVSAIWGGDDPRAVWDIASALCIETIAPTEEALIDGSDAVFILLREGDSHARWAKFALRQGKPVYIDKPFANVSQDARDIIHMAERLQVPVFGGSALRHLPIIGEIRRRIAEEACSHIVIRYSADPESPFGGYHFYGCHLADLAIALLGSRYVSLATARRGRSVTAQVTYQNTQALLLSTPETDGLHISLYGYNTTHYAIPYDECYGLALDQFYGMLSDGIPPVPYDELTATVALTSEITSELGETEISK